MFFQILEIGQSTSSAFLLLKEVKEKFRIKNSNGRFSHAKIVLDRERSSRLVQSFKVRSSTWQTDSLSDSFLKKWKKRRF